MGMAVEDKGPWRGGEVGEGRGGGAGWSGGRAWRPERNMIWLDPPLY